MMTSRRRIFRNIFANTAGVVVNMLSGLLVMPYLIRYLGSGTYGLWILIGTMTGYFGVLDLGISAALGRLVAAHRARGEIDQINRVVSTAWALLFGAFALVCVATCVVLIVFPMLFSVPPDRALDVRYALILVGLNLALSFPASTFMGVLWGYERFDLQNAIDIPVLILRALLSLTMVNAVMPLTSLGAITLLVTLCGTIGRYILSRRVEPKLRIRWRDAQRSQTRQLLALGGWMSVISWSRTLIPQIAPTLIGIRVGNSAVTTFSVARQLVSYANIFSNSATQVLAPQAIMAHATSSTDHQRRLLIDGGQYSTALALFFGGALACLGKPFIHWWQHGLQDSAYAPLLVLLVGELLPMSQWLTYSVLLGANRQRSLGLMALLEGALSLPLIVIFMNRAGIFGACAGVALAGFAVRGVMQWIYGCRLLHLSVFAYARRVFAPVVAAAVVPIAVLYLLTHVIAPRNFSSILVLGCIFAALYVLVLAWALIGIARATALLSQLGARLKLAP